MDLGAYAQIDNLGELAEKNGIYIPRLRGYRLMSEEKPLTKEDKEHWINSLYLIKCEYILRRRWVRPGVYVHEYDYFVNKRVDRIIKDDGIDWSQVHGKLRKKFKYERKRAEKLCEKQISTFNKYAGRNDILMIHARIGGNNWLYYDGPEIEKQSWFLEKVDDCFDNTYCDIYAKLNMEE